jgi:hypothetical protein
MVRRRSDLPSAGAQPWSPLVIAIRFTPDPLRACADRLATFHICRFSEQSNRLLIDYWHIRYPPIRAASKWRDVLVDDEDYVPLYKDSPWGRTGRIRAE